MQEAEVTANTNASIADADIPSTIARDTEVTAAIAAHAAASDPHPDYTKAAEVNTLIAAASIAETQITDGSILARVGSTETVTGAWNFSTLPPRVPVFTVAGLPSAATYAWGLVGVSNETGGAVLAFSDGTDWRRVTDRAVVS